MGIYRNRPAVGLTDNAGDAAPGRHSWYGDQYVIPVGTGRHAAADEGSYFVGTNTVQGTDTAGHVAPALADNDDTPTKALLHIYNGGQRHIAIDYVKLALVVVNASSTATGFTIFVDNHGSTSWVSGGSAITPVSSRSDAPNSTGVSAHFGAAVVATTTAKKVGQWVVRPVIAVTLDQYTFRFGSDAMPFNTGALTGTAVATVGVACAPVVIAPGGNFHLCESNPSGAATAATYQFEFGFWER